MALWSCLALYALLVTALTLTPGPESADPTPNWIPFGTIGNFLYRTLKTQRLSYGLAQVPANIALFVPLGWLLPVLWARLRSWTRVLALAAASSLAIELTQYMFIPRRLASADDVITNGFGALLGAWMFFIARRA